MAQSNKVSPLGALLTPEIMKELHTLFPRKPLSPYQNINELWIEEGKIQLVEILQDHFDNANKVGLSDQLN